MNQLSFLQESTLKTVLSNRFYVTFGLFWDINFYMKARSNYVKYIRDNLMRPNVLLYFVKYPTPGKVKTRLAKTVGDQEAARLYSELAEKNFEVIASLYQRNICDLVIVFDPPEKREDFKRWLSLSCEYLPQCGGGLSEKLKHAFGEAFSAKGGSASGGQKGGKR